MKSVTNLLYQIKLADEAITDVFEKQLGLSLTRYQMLVALLEEAPCPQQRLQERLQIDRAAISRHLHILEEAGYIQRERNPKNQREVLVSPTQQAHLALVEAPSKHHLTIKAEMDTLLSEAEIQHLEDLLDKLVTGLGQLPL